MVKAVGELVDLSGLSSVREVVNNFGGIPSDEG